MLRKIILAAALFVLSASPSLAASRVWIAEFGVQASTASGAVSPIAPLPALAMQSTLDISAGTAQTSAAFSSQTRYIRIVCEVQCAVRGDGSAATSSAILLPGLSPEYFGVQPGSTVSVIASP